jgi:hypothetical protein
MVEGCGVIAHYECSSPVGTDIRCSLVSSREAPGQNELRAY